MARRLWDKGEALHPEILAYTVGDDFLLYLELVEEDVWGSLAHARMLEERGCSRPPTGGRSRAASSRC
jgi:hypothetical protein